MLKSAGTIQKLLSDRATKENFKRRATQINIGVLYSAAKLAPIALG